MHALGLSWNTASDTLHFKLDNPLCTTISKRDVLSRIAQFFDPLGLLSPLIIQAKVFMQELWMIKVSWDMQLHKAQSNTWNRILHGMIRFERIKIPRWIGFFSSVTMKLHGFCDASQTAMAAVVYVRVISRNKSISTSLLCSKTKVAPLKRMTIPRLELSAAVMLAKLISNVQRIDPKLSEICLSPLDGLAHCPRLVEQLSITMEGFRSQPSVPHPRNSASRSVASYLWKNQSCRLCNPWIIRLTTGNSSALVNWSILVERRQVNLAKSSSISNSITTFTRRTKTAKGYGATYCHSGTIMGPYTSILIY